MNRRDLVAGSTALAAASLLDAAPALGQTPGIASPPQGTAPQGTAPLRRWGTVNLAAAVAARRISSREAIVSCLELLGAVNPKVNALVQVLADEALAASSDAVAAGYAAEHVCRAM